MRPNVFPLEISLQPGRVITTLIILTFVLVGLYTYCGRMNVLLGLLSASVFLGFITALKQTFDQGPCIVINDEGIHDKRLQMGIICWSDIERVRMHGVGGAYFISLDLSKREQYLSRQPLYLRLSNQIWRVYNVSPVNIRVAFMDIQPDELFELIMSEVERKRSN